ACDTGNPAIVASPAADAAAAATTTTMVAVAESGGAIETPMLLVGWFHTRPQKSGEGGGNAKRGRHSVGTPASAKKAQKLQKAEGMPPLSKAPDSGDEIEATPPTCTKKKRLKARKLVQENRASTKQREEADTEEWEADSSTTIDPAAAAEGTGDVDVAKGAQCDPIPHPAATSGRHIQGIRDMTGSRTTEPTSGVRDGDDNGSNRDTGGVRPAAEVTKEKTAFDDSEESAAPPPAGPLLQIDAEEPIAGDKQPAVADYHDGARTNAGESVADVKAKG
ncbi:unnamed protein product, partial [Sphacelaria rigidula]